MKKRMLALLLLGSMLFGLMPGVQAAGNLFFVGVNDDIPLLLPGDTAAYYANGQLYAPYTVFDAAPGNINVSYSADQGTLLLFTLSQTLVYDLNEGTLTDRSGKVASIDTVYRNGMLYIPVEQAAGLFGQSVSLMTSKTGCLLLRFTNGTQIYDDEKFLSRSELFITHMLEEYGGLSSGEIQNSPVPEQPTEDEPAFEGEIVLYLAFTGDAVSKETVKHLEALADVNEVDVKATFFLTAAQFLEQRDLVRQIYAKGHSIGLAVDALEQDTEKALREANAAMDEALFCRTLLVLLQEGVEAPAGYRVFRESAEPVGVEAVLAEPEKAHLLICRTDVAQILSQLPGSNVLLLPLLETTQLAETF